MRTTFFGQYFRALKTGWRNLIGPLAIVVGKRMSANTVTTIRMLISFVVPVFSFLAMTNAALSAYVISAFGDAFDGAVAAKRKELKFNDDEKFGMFYDPFCDKVSWLSNNIIHMVWFPHYLYDQLWIMAFVVVGVLLILAEGALMLVRVMDYSYECSRDGGLDCERSLSATDSGKFKQIMECVGLGGIIFSFSGDNTWAFYVATLSYLLALPFALRSLTEKLRARRA